MYTRSCMMATVTVSVGIGYGMGSLSPSKRDANLPILPGMPVVSAAEIVSLPPNSMSESMSSMSKSKVLTKNVLERVSEIMRYGFPSLSELRSRSNYVLSMDRRTRVANWVFEHLTYNSVFNMKDKSVDRKLCEFTEDASLHPFFRASNNDYKFSGYDRGHLAAAGNHKQSQNQCSETFLLSNIAPQVGVGFNRDKWEHLEKYTRNLTKLFENVYVCTGPLYLPQRELDGKNYVKYEVIGGNNVAVPTHFFKVIVCESASGQLEVESYVLPNQSIPDSTPLANFRVPPDSIERASGLLFFDKIDQSRLLKINGNQPKKISWPSSIY